MVLRWPVVAALGVAASWQSVLAEIHYPGDPKYFTKLTLLRANHGDLSPVFSQEVYEYKLLIRDPTLSKLRLMLWLDNTQYDLTKGLPAITFDGKEVSYNPVQSQNDYEIDLGNESTPCDRTMHIRVADPSGHKQLFGPDPWTEYTVHILQPPVVSDVTRPTAIRVAMPDGTEIKSTRSIDYLHMRDNYEYIVRGGNEVRLTVRCSDFATSLKISGEEVLRFDNANFPAGVPREGTSMRKFFSAVDRIPIECLYTDGVFIPGEAGFPHTVSIHRMYDLSNLDIMLSIEEQDGYCAAASIAASQGAEPRHGFNCYSANPRPKVLVMVRRPHDYIHMQYVTLSIEEDGRKYVLPHGVPEILDMPQKTLTGTLRVFGDREPLEFPVRIVQSARCQSYKCPGRLKPKPNIDVGDNMKDRLCVGEICTWRDTPRCCEKAANCATLGMLCPSGDPPAKNATCPGTSCIPKDIHACCYVGMATCITAPDLCAFGHRLRPSAEDMVCSKQPCSVLDAGTCCEPCKSYEPGCNMANSTFSKCPGCSAKWNPEACCEKELARLEHVRKVEQKLELERVRQVARLAHFEQIGCYPEARATCENRTCYYDETCLMTPGRLHNLGCWAGGLDIRCRYCGFGAYAACPEDGSCFDGWCQQWSDEKAKRCRERYNVTCFKLRSRLGAELWTADTAPPSQDEAPVAGDIFLSSRALVLCVALAAVAGLVVASRARQEQLRRETEQTEARCLLRLDVLEGDRYAEI